MKKTVTPLRSLCAALAALVILLALAVPAFAADGFADLYYRVNDSAEVLTEDEDGELETSLEELSVRQSFDVIIATIDSLESEGCTSMEEYADDLYDYCQFGYGENRDGVLLLISTGDRKWHISTCGYGITAFTDAGIQYLGEQMTPDMADGDYAAAFRTFIQWTDAYVTAAREGHPYDVDNMPKEPFSIVYLGVALVIGLITALIVTGVMKSRLKSVAPQRDATSYVRQGSMKLTCICTVRCTAPSGQRSPAPATPAAAPLTPPPAAPPTAAEAVRSENVPRKIKSQKPIRSSRSHPRPGNRCGSVFTFLPPDTNN